MLIALGVVAAVGVGYYLYRHHAVMVKIESYLQKLSSKL